MIETRGNTFYLVRHGESLHNAKKDKTKSSGISWGELEAPLSPKGFLQAQVLAEALQNVVFDAAYSSDLLRATQTAEIVVSKRPIEIFTTSRIRERKSFPYIHSREKAGDTREQVKQEIIDALNMLEEEDKIRYSPDPLMESAFQGMMRLYSFLEDINKAHHGSTILVVNHGDNMRSLLTYLGFAKFNHLPEDSLVNTGYFILNHNGNEFEIKDTVGVTINEKGIRVY